MALISALWGYIVLCKIIAILPIQKFKKNTTA
nr:MAG TPA: hypothetical protein [Caudoviricetes sp.]